MTIATPIWKLKASLDAVTAPKPHRTGAGSRWTTLYASGGNRPSNLGPGTGKTNAEQVQSLFDHHQPSRHPHAVPRR